MVRHLGAAGTLALALVLSPGPCGPGRATAADAASAAEEPDPLFDEDYADEEPDGFPDPLEPMNRLTHRFNGRVDQFVLDPVTAGYGILVPDPLKRAIRDFFANLHSPAVLANDLLQQEWNDAGTTAVRFGLNSTLGLAGLFDPATPMGWEGHQSDFGQTLAIAGVNSGPYLIFPLLGPTTLRDGTGTLVDFMFRPTTYLLFGADQLLFATLQEGSYGISRREDAYEGLKALRDSSIDYYAALRNAYYQNRTAEIWARREHRRG